MEMTMRTATPKVHPVAPAEDPEGLDAPAPRLFSKWIVLGVLSTNLVALLVVGGLALVVRQERRLLREELKTGTMQMAGEMEALRTDVVLSTTENNVFLKILLLKPGIDKGLARDIAHSIVIRAREHHRDVDMVLAIIDVESNFNPNAVSHMGAVGLMQIMPAWKNSFGIQLDLRHVDTSINYGLKILGSYEQTFGGIELALTAYNRGPNAVALSMKQGRVPFNGYAENIMRTYARIKAWGRP